MLISCKLFFNDTSLALVNIELESCCLQTNHMRQHISKIDPSKLISSSLGGTLLHPLRRYFSVVVSTVFQDSVYPQRNYDKSLVVHCLKRARLNPKRFSSRKKNNFGRTVNTSRLPKHSTRIDTQWMGKKLR
jgi:hypothetical protein